MTKNDLYLYNVFDDKKKFMYNAIGFDVESAMEEFKTRITFENLAGYTFVQYRKLHEKEVIEYAKYSKWLTDYINSK
jgi:hypothetical protein